MSPHFICTPTGGQRGKDRFADGVARPELRNWRCDLTGLSHQHNLYFIASVDEIHVHQPSFPCQSLSNKPELVLHPPRSSIHGYGIDPSNPHSISRVLVDYIGNEEILILACDDGDIIAYRTREIHRALEQRINVQEPAYEDGIHVFLNVNVGRSAWGLAVQRRTRMIAISSNTHEITIIAFALAFDNDLEASDYTTDLAFPHSRREHNTFTLQAANNVPAVTFYGDTGRWLLSSSIDGKTSMWDLFSKQEVATFQLGWCASASDLSTPPRYTSHGFSCDCPAAQDVVHGAWGAIALDTRSAYELPVGDDLHIDSEGNSNDFTDVSDQKKLFRVSDRTLYQHFHEEDDGGDNEENNNSDDSSDDEEDDIEDEEEDDSSQLLPGMNSEESAEALSISETQLVSILPIVTPGSPEKAPYRLIQDSRPSSERLDIPFLILTKEEMFLVQDVSETSIYQSPNHIIAIRRPLHPNRWIESLMSCDRHCFFSQIPELGIFIIGSPVGRAGIFSLHYTKDKVTGQPQYGFKVEYLLPFRSDNDKRIAGGPYAKLLGVAVAPMQGMLDSPKDTEVSDQEVFPHPRRWRLLMYYMDHTVLSFELSKRRVGGSPSLNDMVI